MSENDQSSSTSSPKSTPDYGKLRNFWAAKTEVNGTISSSTSSPTTQTDRILLSKTQNQSPTIISTQESCRNNTSNGHIESSNMADLPLSVLEFDQEIVGGNLAQYLSAAQTLGSEIAEHAGLVKNAFEAQRKFLIIASQYVKPNDGEFQQLLAETANAITAIQEFREKRRSSPFFNHLSGVSESIPALAWVTVSPTPGPYVKEMNDAGQFYTNRVLKDFKDKAGHGEWVRGWIGTLSALQAYIKKHHTTGLVWGKAPYTRQGVVQPAGGPPCPPPPPPPSFDLTSDIGNMNMGGSSAHQELFASLNKGESVTSGLKKVSADQMTHKNPSLRAGGVVPDKSSPASAPVASPKAQPLTTKPPKFELEGKKWAIEYQIGQKNLSIGETEMNQVVYMFGCKDSTLVIKGKLNSIVIDSCVKTAIVFDSLVSSVEFVNSRDCQMQVMGTVPTITIDKVDGLQMFLSKDSLQVEIVSAKSSALNVMVPQADGDFAEWPIPEQFKTVIGPKGLVTSATETVGV